MQLLKESTLRYQNKLASFCKTGILPSIPGVDEKHVHQYHRLVKGVFDDSLTKAYPLTHSLLSKGEWDSLVNEFRISHKSQSPQIWRMPYEFFTYFKGESNLKIVKKYPFIIDLLLMEWLEIEVYMMEDEKTPDYYTERDHKEQGLILNPEIRVCSLEFPVHLKKAKDIKPYDKGLYLLSLHRHPESGNVIFTELGTAHVLLMELLQFQESIQVNYEDMLEIFMRYAAKEEAEKALEIFITSALKSRLILGFFNPKYI
ncbi:MAG: putative DNA-binding domain-containing protein [Chitinophagales bacterium]